MRHFHKKWMNKRRENKIRKGKFVERYHTGKYICTKMRLKRLVRPADRVWRNSWVARYKGKITIIILWRAVVLELFWSIYCLRTGAFIYTCIESGGSFFFEGKLFFFFVGGCGFLMITFVFEKFLISIKNRKPDDKVTFEWTIYLLEFRAIFRARFGSYM